MSSWHWKLREWLLAPVIKLQEEEMAKDRDAVNDLKKLLDDQTKAIESVEAHIAADEDTDYQAIKPLLEQAAANNARLTALGGVSPTGTDVSQPVDARTGENTVVTEAPGQDTSTASDPAGQDNSSSDNTNS